jgi:multiple RNA-binding domain-containing protein 1
LVIRNLPFEANVNELRSLVKNYGDVKKVRLPKKLNGAHRGFAFAEFASLEEARNAFEALQSTHFYGRKLVIEYAVETPE